MVDSVKDLTYEYLMSKPERTGMEEWEQYAEKITTYLEKIDALPEQAEDFANSVQEKLQSILEWVEKNEVITDRQQDAVNNICDGIDRWLG